ncbi:MAG: FAD-binding domain-containing protein [Gammaproteobacteria bacterium]|nr:FAD-binding domain-containing protein [Gammaproteobacteria bacterium]
MPEHHDTGFDTRYQRILDQIDRVKPVSYGKTRNFADGAVTRLSPYISRGVISTRMVLDSILQQDLPYYASEKLIQELAWRDYWQQVWIARGDDIDEDLKQPQADVAHHQMPLALDQATTGIDAIDAAIEELYQTGYMHNHMRMYVASVACNIARSHWRMPARWMYFHLLDGDWASNALSWQWVAGSNANKKYFANQGNINKYFYSEQKGSFLDRDYPELVSMSIPAVLRDKLEQSLSCELPVTKPPVLSPQLPTLIYNYYNLDPAWRRDEPANRILLLEPSVFNRFPIAAKNIDFMLKLADNIPGIQLFCGEFAELQGLLQAGTVYYKEHPLNQHYRGHEEPRDWMFQVEGYYPSFFAFWKRCKKEIKSW